MFPLKWRFPKIGVPQNGWFIMDNPTKMDDLGVASFQETPKSRTDCQSTWQAALVALVVDLAAALATWQVCPKTGYTQTMAF